MVSPSGGPWMLRLAALRRAVVFLDGGQLFDTGPDLTRWKTTYSVVLPANLAAGRHRLGVVVANDAGPSLVRVSCPALGLRSGDGWIASADHRTWARAIPIDRPWDVLSGAVAPGDVARYSPLLILLFLVGFIPLLLRRPAAAGDPIAPTIDWGRWIRWALLIAWAILAINNFRKLPLRIGYDINAHYQYIIYVAEHRALPRPDASWQYFQSPFYYVISALFYRLLVMINITDDSAAFALRLIPLACGAVMVELSYRVSKIAFPCRGDLQVVAATVGGLLPVNLYMAQTVSNEPMAAVIPAFLFLLSLEIVARPAAIRSVPRLLVIGSLLGISWITKISTLIWLIPIAAIMARALTLKSAEVRDWFRSVGLVGAAALVFSGWYFVRNLMLVGKPFFAQAFLADARWWQDPGYRTPAMFLTFGHVFTAPVFSGMRSVWDSIYSTMWANGLPSGEPPWNFGLMSCVLWLSVLPSVLILFGMSRSVFRQPNDRTAGATVKLCTGVSLIFVAAIVYAYVTLPIYCCAKASYMLGATPCLALLAAAGFDLLARRRVLRAMAGGVLFAWAVTGYFTYFLF